MSAARITSVESGDSKVNPDKRELLILKNYFSNSIIECVLFQKLIVARI